MKIPLLLFTGLTITTHGQLALTTANDSTVRKYHIGASTYFDDFKGHAGFGALLILTNDGGAAAFGDGDEGTMLIKLDKTGKLQWKKNVKAKGDEVESQCVAQDKAGNFYVFQLVYDRAKYRGGNERVVCFTKSGTILWDKYIGQFSPINNPIASYIRSIDDGRIYIRGHIAPKAPPAGKDPEYHFWEGWLNSAGVLTQKAGEVIDWKKEEWQKKFKPD